MRKLSIAVLAGTVFTAWSGIAAAEDVWMSCSGPMVTTGTNEDGESLNETKQVSDVYAYKDELNGLYFYNGEKQMLSPVHVTSYAADTVTWSGEGSFGARWDGTFGRSDMSINIVRTENRERSEWNLQCEGTGAKPLGSAY